MFCNRSGGVDDHDCCPMRVAVCAAVCGGDLARKMNMVQIHPAGITYERIPPEVAKAAFAAAGTVLVIARACRNRNPGARSWSAANYHAPHRASSLACATHWRLCVAMAWLRQPWLHRASSTPLAGHSS